MSRPPPQRETAARDASPARRHRFPKTHRVLRKADFERAMRDGHRGTDALLTMWVHPNKLPHPRLGLIVGRRHGGAVQRNRIKRLLREAFRLSQYDLPAGHDLVCTPRVGVRLDLSACAQSLTRLAARLAARCGPRETRDE